VLKLEQAQANMDRQKARRLAFRVTGGSLIALLLVALIVGGLFLNSYPLYPKIEGVIYAQSFSPQFSLNTLTSSRLTPASAASVAKTKIFLTGLSELRMGGPKFNLEIMIYSPSGEIAAYGSWDGMPLGTYLFSTVLNPEFTQGVTYHLVLRASFPPANATYSEIDANTPPT
jgi:hypothetical protein